MAPFSLFRRKKQEPQQEPQVTNSVEPVSSEKPSVEQSPAKESVAEDKTTVEPLPTSSIAEKPAEEAKTYLKAMPLRELADIEAIENEVRKGNIIILRITPLASKSITEVKQAVDQLYAFAESIHGDIARLGEERVVICPEKIRIWREKTPAPSAPSVLSTAA